MDLPMLSRKRLFNGHENQPPLCTKKCLLSLKTLLDRYQVDSLGGDRLKLFQVRGDFRYHRFSSACRNSLRTSYCHSCTSCVNRETKHPTDTRSLPEQISSWADTQKSMTKVLQRLRFRRADDDIFLNDSINKKFLQFHRDITEECGAEDKQHSWAVIENQEEIVMYGPYYPNYNSGEHSEDNVIKQTQELLESEAVSEDWRVYVFTMNSPCLARNSAPCMLNLLQKAQEWWSVYGVKTHIGFVKSWGFKGAKENLFRDVNYSQVECINQTEDHESYVKAAEKSPDLNPLCENRFCAVKHLLRSQSFPSINMVLGPDWKSYFKNMRSIFPEDKEVNAVTEAAQSLLSETGGSFEECLEKGQAFALPYTCSSQVSDGVQDQVRLTFLQHWREMVQDRYAELVREKLTEDFNQCTVQLFIKDAEKFTKQYLQIGRIQFPEDDSKAPKVIR